MGDSKALAVREEMEAAIIDAGSSVIKDLVKHIRLWWNGSITGRECAKKCAESCKIGIVELADSGAGAKAGSLVGGAVGGAFGGPAGGAVGSVVGGAVGGVIDWLVKKIFGSKKDDDLKNAYKFLGVSDGASMEAVNSAYKKKALELHPDKGGNKDDFVKLHTCVALIRISKGCE